MPRFGHVPYYEPGNETCKVSIDKFMKEVLPARLRRAGEKREIKINRRRKRMRIVGQRWKEISAFYDEYATAHASGRTYGVRAAVFKAMAALRDEAPICIPNSPGFVPGQIVHGPTYCDFSIAGE